jgi:cobalt/nickel transport system permease protein
MVLHIPLFQSVLKPQNLTPQGLTPQARVLAVGLGVFAIALTPNGRWLTWVIYGLGVGMALILCQVKLLAVLRRVAVELLFIAVVVLGTLFREGGQVLWSWGLLRISTTGLEVLGSVTLKAFLSLLLFNLLIFTTPIPLILQALAILRVPPLLVTIMTSMCRYLDVLIRETQTMRRAALSRNLLIRPRTARFVVGHLIGGLFIRTYDRGERIHQAMLSRGYQGTIPGLPKAQPGWLDGWVLTLICLLALLGQVPYWGM